MNLQEIDFSSLEVKEIGQWPILLRILVVCMVALVTFGLAYFFLIQDKIANLETQFAQEEDKRNEFKTKYNLAANLTAYEKQMIEIKETYKNLLNELPSSEQLPELIENITRQAENNGLKYDSIKPGEAKSLLGFYKELPIDLILTGNYHGFGGFVSDVSKIPRIVTLHDFSIKKFDSTDDSSGKESLVMNIKAKTYWLSSDTDPKDEKGKKGKADDKAPPAKKTRDPVPPPVPTIPPELQ